MTLNVSFPNHDNGAHEVASELTAIDGLFASVFTSDIGKALRVARRLEAGSVGVNVTSPYGSYELPFGGFKTSGIGRQKGTNALMAWTQEKTVYMHHG
jgi:aldehyde dehydrogenase (NAD+)